MFDCLTGEKLARDYDEEDDVFDRVTLIAQGFGPLEGQQIRMGGLTGGGLPHGTRDGWHLHERFDAWPIRAVQLSEPYQTREDGNLRQPESFIIEDDAPCEMRTFGFSETGRSFVVAISCSLYIFARP